MLTASKQMKDSIKNKKRKEGRGLGGNLRFPSSLGSPTKI